MGRKKGSRNGHVLNRKELADLKREVRRLGNNRIAKHSNVSNNLISMLINGHCNVSLERYRDIMNAIDMLDSKPPRYPVIEPAVLANHSVINNSVAAP